MRVLFVDVGFGTCNIILTGSGRAIVIDAGKRTKEPVDVLNHFNVTHISHLIISHWHDDHYGGATGLLHHFSDRIGAVWFPPDPNFCSTPFWNALVKENVTGKIPDDRIRPLFIDVKGTKRIWESHTLKAHLDLVSPSYMQANKAGAAGDSNSTSGVLALSVNNHLIVFSGDASLYQWQEVNRRTGSKLQADVLAVPHHAGIMWPANWTSTEIGTALDNLYTKIVQPKVAIISAGTQPGKKHPREDVVKALRNAKADVMCTQITSRCTSKLETARSLQGSIPMVAPGRSFRTTPSSPVSSIKKNKHVACAGSVLVEILSTGVSLNQLAYHQAFVSGLPNKSGNLPLCRR